FLTALTPENQATIRTKRIAYTASRILLPVQTLLHHFVWFVGAIANGLLRLVRIDVHNNTPDNLSTEELRTIVREAGTMIPKRHQHMLISILDLEKMTVNDIMVPRNEVVGLDLDDDIAALTKRLRTTQHTR